MKSSVLSLSPFFTEMTLRRIPLLHRADDVCSPWIPLNPLLKKATQIFEGSSTDFSSRICLDENVSSKEGTHYILFNTNMFRLTNGHFTQTDVHH